MPTVRAAAERVLKALRDGEVPRRADALRIRMNMPPKERVRTLKEIAEKVLRPDKGKSGNQP